MTNLEVVKAMYEAFENGDMKAWEDLHSPNLVFKISGDLPISGTFNGPDDVIENCFSAWAEHFSELTFTGLTFWESGDTVFVESKVVGGDFPAEGVLEIHKIVIEGEKIVSFQDYFDSAPYLAILNKN